MEQTGNGFFSRFVGVAKVAGTFTGALLGLTGAGIAVLAVGAPVLLTLGIGLGAGALMGFGGGSIVAAALNKAQENLNEVTDIWHHPIRDIKDLFGL